MRFTAMSLVVCAIFLGGPVKAQNIAELRAQYQQTLQMIEQAEAMGVDAGLTSSLRQSLDGIRQSIEEMERDQAAAAQASSAPSEPAPTPAVANAEENLAAGTCGRFGFTAENYRATALSGGDDQIRTLCGQAYEYHAMYKRALAQGHPEAWKTYDAHRQSAAVVNNFWSEAAAAPGEGIQQDTRTAQQVASEQTAAAASAAANAPKRPPPAPSCSGCVTPQ